MSTMILDFRMVESVDATAVKKLKKLLRYTDRVGLKICFTNLTTKMVQMFEEEGIHELRVEENPHGHGHGHDDGHGHGHGHEARSGIGTLRIFKQADAAVEWACDELLRNKHQFNMMLPDPKTGKFTAKIIFRNVLNYIKLGFGALVEGEEFDSASFRECAASCAPVVLALFLDLNVCPNVLNFLTLPVGACASISRVCLVYRYGDAMRWKAGQVIVNQGADPDKLFYITEGSAAMIRRMAFDGSERRLEKKYRGTMCYETEVSS